MLRQPLLVQRAGDCMHQVAAHCVSKAVQPGTSRNLKGCVKPGWLYSTTCFVKSSIGRSCESSVLQRSMQTVQFLKCSVDSRCVIAVCQRQHWQHLQFTCSLGDGLYTYRHAFRNTRYRQARMRNSLTCLRKSTTPRYCVTQHRLACMESKLPGLASRNTGFCCLKSCPAFCLLGIACLLSSAVPAKATAAKANGPHASLSSSTAWSFLQWLMQCCPAGCKRTWHHALACRGDPC